MMRNLLGAGVWASVWAAALVSLAACGGPSSDAAQGQAPAAETAHADAEHGAGHGADHGAEAGVPTDQSFSTAVGGDGHGMHAYKPPDVNTLGGAFELTEASAGKAFTQDDLQGGWSLIYLGYMECLEACPIALKSMPVAVKDLKAAGIDARAVFIDINAPRLDDMTGAMGHGAHDAAQNAPAGHGGHGAATMTGPEVRRQAIAKWSKQYDPGIVMLSGTRKQLMQAKRIFQTRVEQSMLPTQEAIHHLNHTTMIYVMNPAGKIVGLLYHSDASTKMADTVKELARPGSTASRT